MIDIKYQELLQDILDNGVEKKTRNGRTISVFGRQIRHKMSDGFPLLTTKKMYWNGIVTELLWFLLGDTNIKWLVWNGCNIWNGDAYQAYLNKLSPETDVFDVLTTSNFIEKIRTDNEFAKKWGDLGFIYGKQWRNWNSGYERENGYKGIDQIKNLIEQLKTNPNSRRLMVNAWNVGELDQMVLPPCHYGFQCYVRDDKYLSLMWNQRSVDTFLGLPFNIASYGLLLEMIAKEVGMIPDELIGNLGDVHLYKNHIKQAKEQIAREPMKYKLPIVKLSSGHNLRAALKGNSEEIQIDDIILIGYKSHPRIKAPLSN